MNLKKFKNLIVLSSLIVVSFVFVGCTTNDNTKEETKIELKEEIKTSSVEIEDLVINKSEVGNKVKYYPFEVDGRKMQVMAVKTDDGKVRTAFDTCQVCNGSPKAYYEQDGDVVVCQNCGNRFTMSMIEEQKGGCNPIPIMPNDKTETDDTITVDKEFLKDNKKLFTDNWRSL